MASDETSRGKARRYVEYGRKHHVLSIAVQNCKISDDGLATSETRKALNSAQHELHAFEVAHPEEERHRLESEQESLRKNGEH